MPVEFSSSRFASYLHELEQRHLADLRFSDVTRALRALSSTYVERRESALTDRRALDGHGKRAAFALYYGPIHFLLIRHVATQLGIAGMKGTTVDLGCGTGVAGAAIASEGAHVIGIDTHPWALDEARFTYRSLNLNADVRRGHASRTRFPATASCIVAAFVVNELSDADRALLLETILTGSRLPAPGPRVLIVEPISNRISPWWEEWAQAFLARGGRADTWKVQVDLPPVVKRLAKAAGLRPQVLTAKTLCF